MAKYNELLDISEARMEAIKTLGTAIKAITPNRVVALADQNYPTYNTPYIVVDALTDINLSGGMSEQPISFSVDEKGNEYYLYQGMTVVQLDCYLGDAYSDLSLIKNRLWNKNLRYKYFTGNGKYGLTDFRTVNKVLFETDEQKNQQSANMRLTLTWLFAYKDEVETIDEIFGDNIVHDANDVFVYPFHAELAED